MLARVAELALELSVLDEWSESEEGFVFFRFDDDQIDLDDTEAIVQAAGVARQLDLLQSLVSFDVSTRGGTDEIRVGLRSGVYTKR